jgi:hypothetical protein
MPLPRNASEFAAAVAGRMAEQAVKEYLARIGRKGGLKGGKARAMKLSAQKTLGDCAKRGQGPMGLAAGRGVVAKRQNGRPHAAPLNATK